MEIEQTVSWNKVTIGAGVSPGRPLGGCRAGSCPSPAPGTEFGPSREAGGFLSCVPGSEPRKQPPGFGGGVERRRWSRPRAAAARGRAGPGRGARRGSLSPPRSGACRGITAPSPRRAAAGSRLAGWEDCEARLGTGRTQQAQR